MANESNIFRVLGDYIVAAYNFVMKVIEKGRVSELVISSFVLICAYALLEKVPDTNMVILALPALIYAGYWYLMLNVIPESWRGKSSNPNWNDENWWWTLDGWEFEEEVAKVFRKHGYKAEVTKKTGDGGIDIVLHKDGVKYIVQCKHYRNPIPVSYMRELNGVLGDFRAEKAIMVASSGATKQCHDFMKNKPYFILLDLKDIMKMASEV